MSGQVVDAVTKRPIEGAVVVATWRMRALEANVGVIRTLEVTTDGDGRFTVPGWGPAFWPGPGHVDESQPHLWVYAPQYAPASFANTCCGAHTPWLLASMELPLLKLEPAAAAARESGRQLDELTLSLATFFAKAPCEWRRIPKMLANWERAWIALRKLGAEPGVEVGSAPSRCEDDTWLN